jgi:hypothetical protein
MLAGAIATQLKLAGTVSVRLIVPVKPSIAFTATVEVVDVPTVTAAGDVAEMLKSVNATVVDAELYPVAVAVTVAVP